MNHWVRAGLVLMGVGALALAAGFASGAPWATALWPASPGGSAYGSYGRTGAGGSGLSNVFVAAVLASIGTSPLWIAATGETRAIEGGAVDIAVIAGGTAGAGAFASAMGQRGYFRLALGLALLAALGLVIAALARRVPWRDRRPQPRLIRIAFAASALILLVEGGGLVLGVANVFPWALARGPEVAYGFVFLGAMCFFLMALRAGTWGAAASLLAGFLAYDLVLIGPLIGHLDAVEPARLPSLLAYLAAVGASGLVAGWFLFLHPATRVGGLRRGALHLGRLAR